LASLPPLPFVGLGSVVSSVQPAIVGPDNGVDNGVDTGVESTFEPCEKTCEEPPVSAVAVTVVIVTCTGCIRALAARARRRPTGRLIRG